MFVSRVDIFSFQSQFGLF